MSANLSSVPKLQFFDNNGNPLVGGKLYTYEAGTTTPLATYTDSSALTPNTNPIILDSRGEANVWLGATAYKFELKTAADALIWTVDNVSNAINTSQILATGGTAASPPYTFASDTDTGMYLAAVGQLGLTVAGTPVLRSTSTGMTIGQSGGSNDVDVTLYGDLAQTGDMTVDGAAVFNEAGADKDFRVEGDADANLLFVDASTDRVGVGTNTPSVKFDVSGDAKVSGALTVDSTLTTDGLVTLNNLSANADFRVKGVTDASLIFADASVDRVGIGNNTPLVKLHVTQGTTSTNTVINALRIEADQASGTPIAGFGVGMQFVAETSSSNPEIGVTLNAVTTDVTAGSEDFDFVISTMTNGAAASEKVRVRADGNVGIGDNNPTTILSLSRATTCLQQFSNGTTTTTIGSASTNVATFGTTNNYDVRFLVNNAISAGIETSGAFQFNSGYGSAATVYGCRAWINFDGTSGSIGSGRASGNVSSVTDNGTGNYTINFTTAMSDANYAVVFSSQDPNTSSGGNSAGNIVSTASGSFRILVLQSSSNNPEDTAIACASVFH
jgi:hypothetical protein